MDPQHQTVQDQFSLTAEAFSRHAPRDTAAAARERLDFASVRADDYVLDVACGPGKFALACAARTRFARGLDITAEMLREARALQRELGVENACFDLGEAERLPYAANTFDLVSCQFAFHHMPRPDAALAEMVRVTSGGGRLLIVDSIGPERGPESEAVSKLQNEIERLRDPSHTTKLAVAEIRRLVAAQDLTFVKELILDRPYSFDRWMLRAGLAPPDGRYQAVRRLVEESILGNLAGLSPHLAGGELTVVHQEGLFLLRKHGL